ncbi:hypothetical protein [Actinophytocola sp.]|uniref:hypothetical protein n=1 Tax=Actinophytocola sp. TaxID=1872138 RepID=UPI002ED579C6
MDLDGDLDAELRQLFTSDQLDVAVRADAEQVIVTGARRIRRRRIATATAGGVFAVVAVIIGGIVLTGGNPDAMPPATTKPAPPPAATSIEGTTTLPAASSAAAPPLGGTTTTVTKTPKAPVTTKSTEPGPPDLNYAVLGPTGIGQLELGQTLEEAQATGQLGEVVEDGGPDGCSTYKLASRAAGEVYVAGTVQAIDVRPAQTPEGVGPGWSVKHVKTVYSEVDETFVKDNGEILVSVPGNQSAHYRLKFADGLVTGVSLQAADRSCF